MNNNHRRKSILPNKLILFFVFVILLSAFSFQLSAVSYGQSINSNASYITVNSSFIKGDGLTPCTAVVTVNDTSGAPVSGAQVTFSTARGASSDTIMQLSLLTDANGQCTGQIYSSEAGTDSITVECEGQVITRGVDLRGSEGIWHFISDLKDYSGKGYDAIDTGAVWTTEAVFGSAVKFDGVDASAWCTSSTALDTEISVEAWVKALAYPGTNSAQMVGKYGGPWSFTIFPGSFAAVEIQASGAYLIFGAQDFSEPLTLNDWHHLVFTYRDGGNFKTYLDGVEKGSQAAIGTLGDAGGTLKFSNNFSEADGAGGSFNGMINEVKIYSRELSFEEVSALCNRECRITFTFTQKSIVFASPPVMTTKNNPSPAITVQALDENLQRILTFDEIIDLSTSSVNGRFSVSSTVWQDTSRITLAEGQATIYYRDADAGNPVMTVSKGGYRSNTQVIEIQNPVVNELQSYIVTTPPWMRASGIDSVTAVVSIRDTYGFPMQGLSVNLSPGRPDSDAISASPQVTDANGNCTFTISSNFYGVDTCAAVCDGVPVHYNRFVDDFTKPDSANWEVYSGSWQVADGYLNGMGDGHIYINHSDWSDFTYSVMICPTTGVSIKHGISFRIQDSQNYYRMRMNESDQVLLENISAGVVVPITGASGFGFGAGGWYEFKVVTSGSTISCYVNGELKISVSDPTYASGKAGLVSSVAGQGVSFDNVKYYPVHKPFEFIPAASEVSFASLPKTMGVNAASDSFAIEALYYLGVDPFRDTWSYDTVSAVSSSATGRFSTDKVKWSAGNNTQVVLYKGYSKFYYRDSVLGACVITVTRPGLAGDTMEVNIVESQVWETNSQVVGLQAFALADGVSQCSVTVIVRNRDNQPIQGKQVTIYSERGSYDTVAQPGLTDFNGRCTGAVVSVYPGADTVFAVCDGVTITQNLVTNPSFEEEGLEGPYSVGRWIVDWYHNKYLHQRNNERSHSGSYSIKSIFQYDVEFPPWDHSEDESVPILPNSVYRISCWIWNELSQGSASIDLWDRAGEPQPGAVGYGAWERVEGYWPASGNYPDVKARVVTDGNPLGTAWFDDWKLERMPMFEFAPNPRKLVITSAEQMITQNNPIQVTLEARDNFDNLAPLFSNTVALSSSSESGSFSQNRSPWAPVSYITLSSGTGSFYYRDGKDGIPVITVSSQGMESDTQSELILISVVNRLVSTIFASPSTIRADGTETTYITVAINDSYGFPVSGKAVTLVSSRAPGVTEITSDNPLVTDMSGVCTFSAVSVSVGRDTFTSVCDGQEISYLFHEDFSSYAEGSGGAPVWSPATGEWSVQGGAYRGKNSEEGGGYIAMGSSAGSASWGDYTVSFRVRCVTRGGDWRDGPVIGFRYLDMNNHYALTMYSNNNFIHKMSQGKNTSDTLYLAVFGPPVDPDSAWHEFRISVQGNKITVWMDGALKASAVDDSYNGVPYLPKGKIMLSARRYSGNPGTNTVAEFDDFNVYPCMVDFAAVAARLKITSSPFVAGKGVPSPLITVEAQDNAGNLSAIFTGLADISSSSGGGFFSALDAPWSNTGVVSVTGGVGAIYYRDTLPGSPAITVSYGGLLPDSQVESVIEPFCNETNSYLTADKFLLSSDGAQVCNVIVYVKDASNMPIPDKAVTVWTSRGNSDVCVVVSGPTDLNGVCSATLQTSYPGDIMVYASCDNREITENIVRNPSFEGGAAGSASNWSLFGSHTRSTQRPHTGSYSLKGDLTAAIGASYSEYFTVVPNISYKLSAWFYKEPGFSGQEYLDMDDLSNEVSLSASQLGAWQYLEGAWSSLAYTSIRLRCVNDGPATGICFLDDVRMYRIPTVRALAIPVRLEFITPQVAITAGNPAFISAEAWDAANNKTIMFFDSITLSSSSGTGRFSVAASPWSDTDTIYMSGGSVSFYYKDPAAGSGIITISRNALMPDTLVIDVVGQSANRFTSVIRISPVTAMVGFDSITINAVVNDSYGYPVSGETVTLGTARGLSDNISANPQVSDAGGVCTFTVFSGLAGIDTASAVFSAGTFEKPLFGNIALFLPFEEEGGGAAKDISGFGNDALFNGDGSALQRVAGYSGKGLSFASQAYLAVPPSQNLNSADFTVMCWFKPSVMRTQGLLDKGSFMNSWRLFMSNTSGIVEFDAVNDGQGNIATVSGASAGNWSHVAAVYSSREKKAMVYFNGTLENSVTSTGMGNENSAAIQVASNENSRFEGVMDEAKIYNRALTKQEIAAEFKMKANFYFTAYALKFITGSFVMSTGNPSPLVQVEVTDGLGNRVESFNDTISLSCSSANGRFSEDRINWSVSNNTHIYAVNGYGAFYYMGVDTGLQSITVSRSGMTPDSQTENIVVAVFNADVSFLFASPSSAKADGIDPVKVIVQVNDAYGFPMPGRTVTMAARSEITVQANPLVSDASGQCTFILTSTSMVSDVATAVCGEGTISNLYTDNFGTYNVGTLDSSFWAIQSGEWTVKDDGTGNKYLQGKNSGDDGYYARGAAMGSDKWTDYTVSLRMRPLSAGSDWRDSFRVGFREIDANNGYTLEFLKPGTLYGGNGGGTQLHKKAGGATSGYAPDGEPLQGGTLNVAYNQWYSITITVSGNHISVWVDGTLYIDYFDNGAIGKPYVPNGNIVLSAHSYSGAATRNTVCDFDDIRIYPCVVRFAADRIAIVTKALRQKAGAVSKVMTVAAKGGLLGETDTTFSGQVTLATTSGSGVFSPNGADSWSSPMLLMLSEGKANSYYRDYLIGNPVITVTSASLSPDSQTAAIGACSITMPVFSLRTSETSPLLSVAAKGYFNEFASGFNETMALVSTSPAARFSASLTAWQDTTVMSFNSGMLQFYYRDKRGGNPYITVSNPDMGLSGTQMETVFLPVADVTVQQKNLRSGLEGNPLEIKTGDTMEYTVTIRNAGNETGITMEITDGYLFDTSTMVPLAYISMDTNPLGANPVDSWTYTTDPAGIAWQAWGKVPSSEVNVKGLKWLVKSLPAGQTRQVKFRVRVK